MEATEVAIKIFKQQLPYEEKRGYYGKKHRRGKGKLHRQGKLGKAKMEKSYFKLFTVRRVDFSCGCGSWNYCPH